MRRDRVWRHGRAGRALLVVVLLGATLAGWDQGVLGSVVGGRTAGVTGDAVLRVPPASSPLVGLVPGGLFDALGVRLRIPGGAVTAPLELAAPAAEPAPPAPGLPARREFAIALPPSGGFGAAPGPASPPPVQLQPSRYGDVSPSGGTWALLIGINDYPGAQYDLRSAVNDVDDVNEALRRMGVANDRRMVLRDRQATAGVIRAAVDWLTAHAGADATIVFFYAGHVQKLGPGTEALVGADGETVPDVELAALLDRSPARRAWIGVAACYAAGFTELVEDGRILTAAAPANDLAYENEAFGRSYLVEYMVRRAMLGSGITTVEAAFARASAELRRDYPDREPVQFDELAGELDLTSPPSAPDPAPGPAGGSAPPASAPPDEDGCADLTIGVVRCSRG